MKKRGCLRFSIGLLAAVLVFHGVALGRAPEDVHKEVLVKFRAEVIVMRGQVDHPSQGGFTLSSS